jgi:hydrogenase nickel incorporation protein HypA/HybF
MHEYSLVQALVDRVEREARGRKALSVSRLSVRLGALAGVDPALFASAFEICRAGTVCSGALLQLEHVEARWECPRCAKVLAPGSVLRCADCQQPGRLAAGDELFLDRIEMEVPDV